MKRKVSISLYDLQNAYGEKRALEIARDMGADAVDLCLTSDDWNCANPESIYSQGKDAIIAYCNELYCYAKQLGLEIGQTHGRLCIYRKDPEQNEVILKNTEYDCIATAALHAPVCVMHGITTAVMGPDCDPKLMHQLNFERFNAILPFAKENGIQIATETFGDAGKYPCCDFFGNTDEFIKTYHRICAVGDNAKYFTTCVDTGHSNKATRFGNPSSADVIRLLGGSISTLHLNDNDTLTDQHKVPMTGTLDWDDIFDALDKVGYTGNYNMELNALHFGEGFEIETMAFGIKVMKHMLAQRYGEE